METDQLAEDLMNEILYIMPESKYEYELCIMKPETNDNSETV